LSYRFRWVFCQLEYLRDCLPQRIRRALDELPETLDETYTRTLQRISKARQEHACRLFQCVAVASRPLRVEELAEFLAFEFGEGSIPDFNPDWRPENPAKRGAYHMLQLDCDSQCRRFPGHPVLPLFCQGILDIEAHRRGRACCLPISSSHGPCPCRRRQRLPRCSAKIESQFEQTYNQGRPSRPLCRPALVGPCAVRGRVTGHPRRPDQLFDLNKPHFVVWAWICDTIPGFSLGKAFGDVSRLLQRPLNDGVFRDFWDAGVTKHSHDTISWVSYACTLHYILDLLKRDTSVLHSFVLQTAHMPMPAPKEAGLRCVGTSMMHTWAMFVPYRRIAKM
jgi:hypothetical protein